MKKEILIPSGIKATIYQDGDKVVIEYEEKIEWRPKVGEVCYWCGNDPCFCLVTDMCPMFKGNFRVIRIGKYDDKDTSADIKYLRPTNPDERATFFADLKKEGYKWDSKKMVLKKIEEVFIPKGGDFCSIITPKGKTIFIHLDGKIQSGSLSSVIVALSYDNTLLFNALMHNNNQLVGIKAATPSEKQLLLDAMHKAGKDWDAVNKKVVDYVWKPKTGERYYAPAPIHNEKYVSFLWEEDYIDNRRLSEGLVYRTSEEAIARAKRMLNTK
jgi:hypothetical protein